MRVEIDYSLCATTGQCALIAPDVFRVTSVQTEFDPEPDERHRDKARLAAQSCPVEAITVD